MNIKYCLNYTNTIKYNTKLLVIYYTSISDWHIWRSAALYMWRFGSSNLFKKYTNSILMYLRLKKQQLPIYKHFAFLYYKIVCIKNIGLKITYLWTWDSVASICMIKTRFRYTYIHWRRKRHFIQFKNQWPI